MRSCVPESVRSTLRFVLFTTKPHTTHQRQTTDLRLRMEITFAYALNFVWWSLLACERVCMCVHAGECLARWSAAATPLSISWLVLRSLKHIYTPSSSSKATTTMSSHKANLMLHAGGETRDTQMLSNLYFEQCRSLSGDCSRSY